MQNTIIFVSIPQTPISTGDTSRCSRSYILQGNSEFKETKSFIMGSKYVCSLLWREMLFLSCLLYKCSWRDSAEQRQLVTLLPINTKTLETYRELTSNRKTWPIVSTHIFNQIIAITQLCPRIYFHSFQWYLLWSSHVLANASGADDIIVNKISVICISLSW